MPSQPKAEPLTLVKERATLDRMTTQGPPEKYAAVFGEQTTAGLRAWLARRVGWRLQALADGDLSDRATGSAIVLRSGARMSPTTPEPL